ncbi:Presequence translocated-associated motor subunit PAM17, mitochondrial [Candida viswanathii]|uniref:Presequence translocated-associated motor subunit PAM17 n=1 Tax=Candida viswanathii TaxID=5486 RepID=A0A367YFF3_9ASCO|nr:Presequence translocated-associated motor subunit PAM17, mitochondrial [Candida viswanathii]
MFALGVQNRLFTRRAMLFKSFRFNSTTAATQPKLTWVDYFNLKKQNTRINTIAGVFTGVGGAFLTLSYLGNIEIDVEKPIMGFDPLMIMGGAVVLGGLVGYLVGPFIGSFVFRMTNRAQLQQFERRNSEFLTKLRANRPDPSSQSFSNPIPDYYGEKIYSLKDYMQWLRDCNAFRRKAKEFL